MEVSERSRQQRAPADGEIFMQRRVWRRYCVSRDILRGFAGGQIWRGSLISRYETSSSFGSRFDYSGTSHQVHAWINEAERCFREKHGGVFQITVTCGTSVRAGASPPSFSCLSSFILHSQNGGRGARRPRTARPIG